MCAIQGACWLIPRRLMGRQGAGGEDTASPLCWLFAHIVRSYAPPGDRSPEPS
jgi:hypothetical protein